MAGLEERLTKLESILHRLFCCDTNQFTGDAEIQYNPTAKVIEYVDMMDQFTIYWFTARSNF